MEARSTAGSRLKINISTFPGKDLQEALAVRDAFQEALKHRSYDELGFSEVRMVGWRGFEGRDAMVEIRDGASSTLYQMITPDMASKIIQQHFDQHRSVQEWQVRDDYHGFYTQQTIRVSEIVGQSDPGSLQDYLDQDGYKGLLHFYQHGFTTFLDKLYSFGAADPEYAVATPLASSWRLWRNASQRPVLAVNGALPTQDATAGLLLMEGAPHQVLEGVLLAANAIEAAAVVFYLPARQHLALQRLQGAWQMLDKADVLPFRRVPVDFVFLAGEARFLPEDEKSIASHLQASLPDTFLRKHAHRPFLVQGIETLAALPILAQQCAYGIQELGTEATVGTRIYRLTGAVARPGFAEIPMGSSLADLVEAVGGGVAKGSRPKAIWVGGPIGGFFPFDLLHLKLDPETLQGLGAAAVIGTVRVLDQHDCIVSLVREQVAFLMRQPGGQCPTCHVSLKRIESLLTQIIAGSATEVTLDDLRSTCEKLKQEGSCQLGRQAANPILTSLQFFAAEYRMHAENKHCPARVCPKLLLAPCHMACPSSIDIPSYLALVSRGQFAEALRVIREDNPFPWVCGLICPHPCEKACVRANLDDPINIRYLKAFVADWTTRHAEYAPFNPAPQNNHKVAVVGSGPAGLSAAHFLALKGYRVTIFESLPVAGGLLMVGIPEYRLPRSVVQKEIDTIRSLGVEIRTGVTVGTDVQLDDLRRQGYAAFFLGIGAHRGYQMKIEGEEDFPQVYDAITFLRQVNLGNRQKPASGVVVVGGGNSAMDAARTCLRLGCAEVHVAYRRSRDQMPANPEEVEEAIEEGVRFHFLAVPVRVGGEDGQVTHLECLRAELGKPDASGRRRPIPVADSNFRIEAGAVIAAIGQQPDFRHFKDGVPVQVTPRNLIVTEPFGTRTNVVDIFSGGDGVSGPATVVEAIAAGKQAALDIDHYLAGRGGTPPPFHAHKRRKVPFSAVSAAEKIATHRVPMPLRDAAERKTSFYPVELGYSEDLARTEARRCLRCDVCIRCGTCEKVCRDAMQVHALKFSQISTTERILSDYQRAVERCIACGACALACPTNAIDFIETVDKREVRLCGTILNQLEVARCKMCGEPFVPQRYLAYVTGRSDAVTGKNVLRRLCPGCARKKRAQGFVKL